MSFAIIKLGLLMLAFIPLLIDNMRTGRVTNALTAILLAIGVLTAILGVYLGADPLTLSAVVGWILTALLLLGLAAYGAVSGGVAKFLIALLPWFAFGDYLWVVIVGMGLAALVGWASRKNALIVPPVMAAALAVGLMPVLAIELL